MCVKKEEEEDECCCAMRETVTEILRQGKIWASLGKSGAAEALARAFAIYHAPLCSSRALCILAGTIQFHNELWRIHYSSDLERLRNDFGGVVNS